MTGIPNEQKQYSLEIVKKFEKTLLSVNKLKINKFFGLSPSSVL